MKIAEFNSMLMIMGCFITIGLAINAFFVKGLMSTLGKVELGLAVILTKNEATEKLIEKNAKDIEKLYKETFSTRQKFHELRNELNTTVLTCQSDK